ncbi:uncharacterized protein LOC106669140 isoform X1 [Cimex lectularius]|uniref:Uncharacterized protein n=1 Tax=Cimex lectularius TaxID=79782 RepID=A0A8I6S604_CIMLE|nr:uncharacterized protein LOC106669140 isoform X1 [Cimex lectularius]
MSSNSEALVEDIFEFIKSIIVFIQLASVESLRADEIDTLFNQGFYVETIYTRFKLQGQVEHFNESISNYFSLNNITLPLHINLEILCDFILAKFLIPSVPNDLTRSAIRTYLKLCSKERFNQAIQHLSELRPLFLSVSSLYHRSFKDVDIESAIFIKSWTKIIEYRSEGRKEVESIMTQMIKELQCSETILCILSKSNAIIQESLIKQLNSVFDHENELPIWGNLIFSDQLVNACKAYPESTIVVFKILGFFSLNQTRNTNSAQSKTHIYEIVKELYAIKNLKCLVLEQIMRNVNKFDSEFWSFVYKKVRSDS